MNLIWNNKNAKQQNSNIYLHGFEVPDSKFLIISSSLRTSSQGVKQTILREQSIWFCCALPSYITGAPTTLANAIQSADTGSVGEGRIMQGQDCIQWRWHHERHRRMSSKSHESMKFGIKDWGWFLMLGRLSTILDTGIHWTYTWDTRKHRNRRWPELTTSLPWGKKGCYLLFQLTQYTIMSKCWKMSSTERSCSVAKGAVQLPRYFKKKLVDQRNRVKRVNISLAGWSSVFTISATCFCSKALKLKAIMYTARHDEVKSYPNLSQDNFTQSGCCSLPMHSAKSSQKRWGRRYFESPDKIMKSRWTVFVAKTPTLVRRNKRLQSQTCNSACLTRSFLFCYWMHETRVMNTTSFTFMRSCWCSESHVVPKSRVPNFASVRPCRRQNMEHANWRETYTSPHNPFLQNTPRERKTGIHTERTHHMRSASGLFVTSTSNKIANIHRFFSLTFFVQTFLASLSDFRISKLLLYAQKRG